MLTEKKLKRLERTAKKIRIQVLEMIYKAGSGHLGSSFSTLEFLVALYSGRLLKFNPQKPAWPERDYFLLSNGHACPALYAVLAENRFFPIDKLNQLRQFDSGLEGHPKRDSLPGVEISSGSLGMGLGQGVGLALALKLERKTNRVVVMMSDGEQDEGAVWEAVMAASHYQLDNLVAIVDRNQVQIGGYTEEQMALAPLAEKYQSFGWQTAVIDGHDFQQIFTAYNQTTTDRPMAIISQTKGAKGLAFIEGTAHTHHPNVDEEFYKEALRELKKE